MGITVQEKGTAQLPATSINVHCLFNNIWFQWLCFQITSLSKVNHRNFMNLLGYCEEGHPFTRAMVFEYAPNGTLFEYLHGKYIHDFIIFPSHKCVLFTLNYRSHLYILCEYLPTLLQVIMQHNKLIIHKSFPINRLCISVEQQDSNR
jgi:hypothetical protein